ncbi:hypothetical protein [Arthrobacter psychrolactophilus]|nr:hypothetical protein [Arthrobacter psychrolactophilus]
MSLDSMAHLEANSPKRITAGQPKPQHPNHRFEPTTGTFEHHKHLITQ